MTNSQKPPIWISNDEIGRAKEKRLKATLRRMETKRNDLIRQTGLAKVVHQTATESKSQKQPVTKVLHDLPECPAYRSGQSTKQDHQTSAPSSLRVEP